MAKQQTFVDKSSQRAAEQAMISVKVIVASKTEKGTYRFNERFVKVKEIGDVEKLVKG